MSNENRLRPIRLDPKYRWFFVRTDISDAYARATELMNMAIWTAEDDLRDSIIAGKP